MASADPTSATDQLTSAPVCSAIRVSRRANRLFFAGRDRDLRAFGSQCLSDGEPQPLAGRRNHRNLSFDS